MDFAYMPVGGPLGLPTARRNLTLPAQPTTQRSSPPHPSAAGPSRLSMHNRRPVQRAPSLNLTQDTTLPMQKEIDRLTAACEEHERRIRSIRGSIEHRLFVDLPAMLTRLTDKDDDADRLTTEIYDAIRSTLPPMQQRLSELVAARTRDLETMRERTTPWQTLFAEADELDVRDGQGKAGRIQRVAGISKDGSDGLARIEWWADETEMLLNAEIVRLKAELASKSTTSRRIWRLVVGSLSTVVLALMVLLILAQLR